MKLEVKTITPAIAKHLLTYNIGNRQMRRSNVQYWKSALIGNAVTLTHQGIAIAGDLLNPLRLIDGQHRLTAIVETGISMDVVVCQNTPEGAFMNLDNGMPRSLGDRAGISAQQSQMASTFFYLAEGGKTIKPPVKLIQEIHGIIAPFASQVANNKKRSFSPIGIRAAFVAQQRTRGTNFAAEFQDGKFGALTESLAALYRRQATRPIGIGGGAAVAQAFCVTWKAICRPTISKIHLSENPSDEAATVINETFPEVPKSILKYRYEIPTA
jgi:hypothetical protein